jgi:hypothetical protein
MFSTTRWLCFRQRLSLSQKRWPCFVHRLACLQEVVSRQCVDALPWAANHMLGSRSQCPVPQLTCCHTVRPAIQPARAKSVCTCRSVDLRRGLRFVGRDVSVGLGIKCTARVNPAGCGTALSEAASSRVGVFCMSKSADAELLQLTFIKCMHSRYHTHTTCITSCSAINESFRRPLRTGFTLH